jgi:glutamate-1-semialdehyde 2,1-aminomutase
MIVDDYIAMTPKSRELAERAARVLPDGVSTDTRLFDPYGIYVGYATGTRKWDVDGNEYRDFFGGHGAMMLGHSHPRVTRAIQNAVGRGIQFAAGNPAEVEWAELIQKHIPTAERVRFTGSGTEATLLAIRVARAFTGRSKLVRVRSHYHGWHDFAVSGYNDFFDGRPAPGVLPEIARNTLLVTPDDAEDLHRVIAGHRAEIAAILLEPLGSHFGVVPTGDAYLKDALALAKQSDIPVILDEVITAFRVGPAGMQGLLGIQPDLTCMAKVAAGGMPGGIVCGSARIMAVLARASSRSLHTKVFHQGTFTGNPVTASAAVATIDEVVSRNLCEHASNLAQITRARLNELFERMNLRWRAYGRFSAFHILPGLPDPLPKRIEIEKLSWDRFATRSVPLLQNLRMALNLEGVDIGSRGTGFFCGVHQADDVQHLLAAFERALVRMQKEGGAIG